MILFLVKILPFGAGIAAGITTIASAVNVSDCNISGSEKGAMDSLDNIGLSKLTSIYMKKFDDRCIPPLVETYTCTDGKIYATNIHQPTNKIKVGECTSDSKCSEDGKICLENPLSPSEIPPGSVVYNNTIINLTNPDDKYIETVKNVCDSLPEHFCRGATIEMSEGTPKSPRCQGAFYVSETDTTVIHCPEHYNYNDESLLIYTLVHELIHRAQFTLLGQDNTDYYKVPTLNKSFEYYMQWSYNPIRRVEADIFSQEKLNKAQQMMRDFYSQIDIPTLEKEEYFLDYFSSRSTENAAEFAMVYYADSLKFKEIFPELYRYYRDLVFQGREYKDGVWINP